MVRVHPRLPAFAHALHADAGIGGDAGGVLCSGTKSSQGRSPDRAAVRVGPLVYRRGSASTAGLRAILIRMSLAIQADDVRAAAERIRPLARRTNAATISWIVSDETRPVGRS